MSAKPLRTPLLLTALVALACASVSAADFRLERELALAPGGTFVLDSDAGSIDIRGTDRSGARVLVTSSRDDIEGIESAILMHPRVWEASGHVGGFTDPLVDCKKCKNRFRADDPSIKGTPGEPDAQCPVCGNKGTLTTPRLASF